MIFPSSQSLLAFQGPTLLLTQPIFMARNPAHIPTSPLLLSRDQEEDRGGVLKFLVLSDKRSKVGEVGTYESKSTDLNMSLIVKYELVPTISIGPLGYHSNPDGSNGPKACLANSATSTRNQVSASISSNVRLITYHLPRHVWLLRKR